MALVLTPLKNVPLVQPGDNLPDLLWHALDSEGIQLADGDILVLAQKVVSKSENRFVNLSDVIPSEKALAIAPLVLKDPRFVELVLQESKEVIRTKPGAFIVEHRLGFLCANAGIDHSNVNGPDRGMEDWVLLLPVDADRSAREIREQLEAQSKKHIGVMIIDSHGRPWRNGVVGTSIGFSGMPGLVDRRGEPDLFGKSLKITTIGAADELAGAASLVMGQAAEGIPAVHVRGFPYPLREGNLAELIRPKSTDLFR